MVENSGGGGIEVSTGALLQIPQASVVLLYSDLCKNSVYCGVGVTEHDSSNVPQIPEQTLMP